MARGTYVHCTQGRREPNVGPGTAQTWMGTLKLDGPPLELKYDGPPQIGWAPGFVKSKTDGENAAAWSQI